CDIALEERCVGIARDLVHAGPRLVLADEEGAMRQQLVLQPGPLQGAGHRVVVDVVMEAVHLSGEGDPYAAESEGVVGAAAGGAAADSATAVVLIEVGVPLHEGTYGGREIAVRRHHLD